MYEKFRNEFIAVLAETYNNAEIGAILSKLDMVSINYDFVQKELELVPYDHDEIPPLLKLYIGCKKSEGVSDKTLYTYMVTLKNFFAELRKEPAVIRTDEIRVYLYKYQQEKQISYITLDKYRMIISNFFGWCHEEGYIQTNPASKLKAIKYEKKERMALNQIELEYVRRACITKRDTAMVEFLYSTACRVSELTSVKLSDIDWHAKTVHLYGKGKKHRTSYLNAKAEVALRAYLDERKGESEYLFSSTVAPYGGITKAAVEKSIRTIGARASKHVHKPITPHVFRHTSATAAMNGGMPITDICKFLGHEKIETTMIYAHTMADDVQMGHKKFVV